MKKFINQNKANHENYFKTFSKKFDLRILRLQTLIIEETPQICPIIIINILFDDQVYKRIYILI